MNAYGEEVGGAARATDILAAIVREGNLEASSLAPVLGRVVGLASQMGVTFEEVGASIATYTRLGISAEEATTALRGILSSILKPGSDAAKALEEIGLSAQALRQQVAEDGLQATLSGLIEQFKGNEEALARVIPNVRALSGVLGTAGSQGEQYAKSLDQIIDSNNLVNDGFEKQKETLEFQRQQLAATGQAAQVAFGNLLLPLAKDSTQAMTRLAEVVISEIAKAEQIIDNFGAAWETVGNIIDDIDESFGTFSKTLDPEVSKSLGAVSSTLEELADVVAPGAKESIDDLREKGFLELYLVLNPLTKALGDLWNALWRVSEAANVFTLTVQNLMSGHQSQLSRRLDA